MMSQPLVYQSSCRLPVPSIHPSISPSFFLPFICPSTQEMEQGREGGSEEERGWVHHRAIMTCTYVERNEQSFSYVFESEDALLIN